MSDIVLQVRKLLSSLTLKTRMIVYVVVLVFFQLIVLGSLSSSMLADVQLNQLSKRALSLANSIALSPEIQRLIAINDPDKDIQKFAERVRLKTEAEFIVIGDKDGRRFSHPNSELIGQLMVGGDNTRALLYKEEYISRAIGTLGPSLRAKVPVIQDGIVIGVVSIGFLERTITSKQYSLVSKVLLVLLLLLTVGVISAAVLARSFKKAIFDLEPSEIGRLFSERNIIIESVREGIIATDKKDQITLMNKNAFSILGVDNKKSFIGSSLSELISNASFQKIIKTGKSILDSEVKLNNKIILCNSIPLLQKNKVVGVVTSFRLKDEIDSLGKELCQLKDYSELMRAQTHEYSNKLHTISGLIQLGANEEAIELIGQETSGYQELMQLLIRAVPDPIIAGCILGKYNRAKELGIELTIDNDSSFTDVPLFIDRHQIVSIIGNLLDNAFDALLKNKVVNKRVNLSLVDLGNDLIIEVEDEGNGVKPELQNAIFEKGFSTNEGQGRGMGLNIVKKSVHKLNGQITLSTSSLGGALFTVYLPKEGKYNVTH